MDLLQMLVNVASDINQAGVNLVITLAGVTGVLGAMVYLMKHARPQTHRGTDGQGGKLIAAILLCSCLVALKQVMNASAHQLGFGDVSFDAVAYVSTSTFGEGADAVNAVLTLVRLYGAVCFFRGLLRIRRALMDGHTGLSASDDVTAGINKVLLGTLLTCVTELLDAIQNTLQIHF